MPQAQYDDDCGDDDGGEDDVVVLDDDDDDEQVDEDADDDDADDNGDDDNGFRVTIAATQRVLIQDLENQGLVLHWFLPVLALPLWVSNLLTCGIWIV